MAYHESVSALKACNAHSTERALTSDWYVNSIIRLSIRIFFKVQSEFSVQAMTKNFFS